MSTSQKTLADALNKQGEKEYHSQQLDEAVSLYVDDNFVIENS